MRFRSTNVGTSPRLAKALEKLRDADRKNPLRITVVGLDLSLRGPAIVSLRDAWSEGWQPTQVRRARWEMDLQDKAWKHLDIDDDERKEMVRTAKVKRLVEIATHVEQFVQGEIHFAMHRALVRVFVEDYSFGSPYGRELHGELRGAVTTELFRRTGLVVQAVAIGASRKTFLGKVPAKDAKVLVEAKLGELGSPFETNDECDAFVVANHGRSLLGMPFWCLG